ncbi:E3 ubiquitin ligase family protein [Halopseudomonas salegens]|uniref:RING-type E3 ubiquitin transferase n=1 Tax=Halopseudomonas salegens TaxID=1434072 RepID=A0A1H2FXX2_9GAMM|nr:E3 ubiquitin ligase family protein [Halopseudomonas salegens]SDU11888.1 E3 Ubiquitin ligase [Halopseudomonas salegens]
MIDVHGLFWLPPGQFWMLLLFVCVATLACAWLMFSRYRRARWIEDTPRSRIRSAAQGLVELAGRLESGGHAPLVSPLGGANCLWYRFKVEEYRSSGRNSRWRVIESGESERPFLLCDETGQCWIDPRGAEVHPARRRRWEGRQRWPLNPGGGSGVLNLLVSKRYRYSEELLLADEVLYALGWFKSRGGGREAVDERAMARRIISNWKADYTDLLARFDHNRDGQLDMQEWQQVQQAAASEASSQAREQNAAEVVHTLSRPPRRGLPFLLSDHHEDALSGRMRRHAQWSCAGFVLAGAGAVWLALALVTS